MNQKGKKKDVPVYDTDTAAINIFSRCVREFQTLLPNFRRGLDVGHVENIKDLRAKIDDYDYSSTGVYRFKAHHQIQSFLKKYRFAKDVYSDSQLKENSYYDYFIEQERVSSHSIVGILPHMVLQEARKIAASILGEFRGEDIYPFCKFGTNSNIGCPLSLAHIDLKLSTEGMFTGSSEISIWFRRHVFNKDAILRKTFSAMRSEIDWHGAKLRTDSLALKDVPKTWKTLRLITPLALLDLYYSNGIGGLVTEKLSNYGLRISNLQQKHRKLIQRMSIDKRHATADLSKASDSITCQILNRVLPRAWYVALKPILKHRLKFKDPRSNKAKEAYTASVLPMGNGATFPVETLVFYCIIRALGNLAKINGIYSVYGDDLIYPSRLHTYVVKVFPLLGLKLNLEKTYVDSNFRESCGADYYHGIDVRPFFLKGEHQLLTRSQYSVWLYKVYNGLRLRWEECELPSVFTWILAELALDGKICRVPPSYPSSAGIQTLKPSDTPMGLASDHFHLILRSPSFFMNDTKYSVLQRPTRFKYMLERAYHRFVLFQEPYYWQTLSGFDDTRIKNFWTQKIVSGVSTCVFKWVDVVEYKTRFKKGKRVKVKVEVKKPCVAEKNLTRVKERDRKSVV